MKRRRAGTRCPGWRGVVAAAWSLACLLPAPACALGPGCQVNTGGGYTMDKGASLATGRLAPDTILLDKTTVVGTVVYDQPLPPVPWICVNNSLAGSPFLSAGAGLQKAVTDLKAVGLQIVLQIGNYPPWVPTGNSSDDRFRLSDVLYAPASATDATPTAKGLLLGNLRLVVTKAPDKPISMFIPANPDFVRMNPQFLHSNHIEIGSLNGTNVSFIPRCIAKITTPGTIPLGRAYAMTSLPLPPPVNFTLYADFDPTCDGGFDLNSLGKLIVPLKIQFQPADAAALSANAQGIILKNSDGQANGLSLELKENGVIPVVFNRWTDAPGPSLSTSVRPVPLYYTAELTKSGTTVIPGKYSQKVTVLVTFQ